MTHPDYPLTPAERVEMLIDAITLGNLRRQQVTEYALTIDYAARNDLTPAEAERMGQMIDAEIRADEEIVARARTLMAGGLLERCADILRAEFAGRI